jgi:2'-5' RNA ligase
VLSVGVVDGKGALGRLQGRVAGALAAGGWYEPEQRPFLPHVTLVRVRGRAPLRLAPGDPLAVLPAVPVCAFAGTAVTLYRSLLGRGGARYEPLARAALQ